MIPSSYGGNVFSDFVGGTSPSYTGFSLIGGSKKRRRTKRKKGKRTRHCRCKVCKCKKCRCNKKFSKKGGSRKTGYVAVSEDDVMKLYKKLKEDDSKRAYDAAERQLDSLRKEGVNASRETDIVNHVLESSRKSPNRKSSTQKRGNTRRSGRKRRSRNSFKNFIRSLRDYYEKLSHRRNRLRTKRITDKPKAGPNKREEKYAELLKKLGLNTDEKIGEYIDNKSNKSVKKARREAGFVKQLQEVVPDGKDDYKITGKTFDVIDVGGGGDCFFRVVAYLVFGDKNRHSELRKAMIKYVDDNENEIINQDINGLPITTLMSVKRGGGKGDKRGQNAGSYEDIESIGDKYRIIDNYIRDMGTRGTWAEGSLEYYFMCGALFDKYGIKVKMLVYTYPCVPDKEEEHRPCLRNIKDGYRKDYCTIVPDGLFQNNIFEDDTDSIEINILNSDQLHYLALVPVSP
mgnify:CR=1 FL=1|tara:strand:+ start:1743 stop:3116 length:1374 start_codon:yes stop_codon:yes gene_type:complete